MQEFPTNWDMDLKELLNPSNISTEIDENTEISELLKNPLNPAENLLDLQPEMPAVTIPDEEEIINFLDYLSDNSII